MFVFEEKKQVMRKVQRKRLSQSISKNVGKMEKEKMLYSNVTAIVDSVSEKQNCE